MKTHSLTIITVILALIISGFSLLTAMDTSSPSIKKSATPQIKDEHKSEHQLLDAMGYFQRFSTKLYWAGTKENWELADFYMHELEETLEELTEANIHEDGVNLSDLATEIALPSFERLEGTVKAGDKSAFTQQYQMLVNSCNACHARTGKSFIQIRMPEGPIPYNQAFGPLD